MKFLALKKTASLVLPCAALVFQLTTAPKAWAHYPVVTASAICSNGAPVISYTVTSWDPGNFYAPGDGDNSEIDVLFNGVAVDAQPFLPNTKPADTFSGVKAPPQATTSVDVQAIAIGHWGDNVPGGQTSNVVTVTIPTSCEVLGTGRFTGGGKQITVSNVAVTKGFEVDCDLHQPSNNLEINWQGHHFHMTAFLAAVCSLQGNPTPPPAPVNTIVGMGTGRYDGADGYSLQFELVDNGEPGKNDEAAFKVYETANPANVVLNVPIEFITGGNIQAHVDQK